MKEKEKFFLETLNNINKNIDVNEEPGKLFKERLDKGLYKYLLTSTDDEREEALISIIKENKADSMIANFLVSILPQNVFTVIIIKDGKTSKNQGKG